MRRVGAFLLGVVLLLGVVVAHTMVPDSDRRLAPLASHGTVGEAVDTGGFTLTVEKVQAAHTLVEEDSFVAGPPLATDGIWVVVTATLVGEWEAATYDNTRLVTLSGDSYDVSERIDSSVSLVKNFGAEPGIPRRGQIAFEIPPDRLEGAVLRVTRTSVGGDRLAPEAVVDLGLDADTARRLVDDAPKSLGLRPVEYAR